MKRPLVLSIPGVVVIALIAFGAAKKDAKCPISGKPVKDSISLTVNGEKVAFCCEGCPKAYKKKIGLVDDGPKNCPISGGPAKASSSLIHREAKALHFCCGNCPKAYVKKNGIKLVDKGPTKCPISGGAAKKADGTSLVINGETIYFCCKNCPKAYLKKLWVTSTAVGDCPISGNPGKAETGQIHVTSKSVYFCCKSCPKKYVAQNFKKSEKKAK